MDIHRALEEQVKETPQRRLDAEKRLRVFAGNFALPNLLDSCARYMREDGKENKRLREALENAEKAIDSLPPEALGSAYHHDSGGEAWPIRDELLANIRAALGEEESK